VTTRGLQLSNSLLDASLCNDLTALHVVLSGNLECAEGRILLTVFDAGPAVSNKPMMIYSHDKFRNSSNLVSYTEEMSKSTEKLLIV